MVKLTVFFKDKVLHTSLFESGTIHLGRDESNDVVIDSLAVAPAHAAIVIRNDGCFIKQLNDDFHLIINGKKMAESPLGNNDTISIGKHDIVFNTNEFFDLPAHHDTRVERDLKSLNEEINPDVNLPNANLQFINGKNIGKVLPLKKSLTRLTLNNGGVIIIAKRTDGYYVSALEDGGITTLNDQPLQDNSLKLHNNDVLNIETTSLQFFMN